MTANFSANGYTIRTGASFTGNVVSNLSFTSTSNVSTLSFDHETKTSQANSFSKALNISVRPSRGQLYPR